MVDLERHINLKELAGNIKSSYEPKRFSGLILHLEEPNKAGVLIFASGKIVVAGNGYTVVRYNGGTAPESYFYLYPDTAILHNYLAENMASGVPPITYLWSWGDGTTDTIALPSHTYGTSGFYTICLTITDSTGCSSMYCDSSYLSKNSDAMVYVNVIAQTGITVCSINKSFLIYPNPASDYLTLKFAQNISKAEIKIYNLSSSSSQILSNILKIKKKQGAGNRK